MSEHTFVAIDPCLGSIDVNFLSVICRSGTRHRQSATKEVDRPQQVTELWKLLQSHRSWRLEQDHRKRIVLNVQSWNQVEVCPQKNHSILRQEKQKTQ